MPSYASDISENTSDTLIRRLKSHDAAAWERFVQLYGPLIYRWTRSCGLQEADGADVAQDVLRKVLENLNGVQTGKEGPKFRAWLWTVTRNTVRDLIRAKARRGEESWGAATQQALEQLPEQLQGAEAETAKGELVQRALQLIQTDFDEATYQAFKRMVVDDRPAAEVADELAMTANAVRQAKFRILRRLREDLDE